MPCSTAVLDGNMIVPHPAHVGWKLEDIARIYATPATVTLCQIYKQLAGENESVATAKELSERSGRPIVVFVQQDELRFYTPQRYQLFSPLVLTYSPTSGLFGMAACESEAHHDFVCYLCAHGIRIENIADVPNHMLYPYLASARAARDNGTKLEFLHAGRMNLKQATQCAEGSNYFDKAIAQALEMEKHLSEDQAISLLRMEFACNRLSKIDADGAAYAARLSGLLLHHGGDTKVANDLRDASAAASIELDAITATTVGMRLTDELLGAANSSATTVAKKFTEHMGLYNISVENDIYPWKTLTAMESGDVVATFVRHEAFHLYRRNKILGQDAIGALVERKNRVPSIHINSVTTIEMVSTYNRTVKDITSELFRLTQMDQPLPDISTLEAELSKMTLRGGNFTKVVLSLQAIMSAEASYSLSTLVQNVVSNYEKMPLEKLASSHTHTIPLAVAVGEALQNVGEATKLHNARFDMSPAHLAMVLALVRTPAEQNLGVNFMQRTVVSDIVHSQPMGSHTMSPFKQALVQWEALRTNVTNVAQTMTTRMVRFANFCAADPKAVLSNKLHAVGDYEQFAKDAGHWNFIDIPKATIRERMRENMKFIRAMLAAFADQDDENCARLRSFTARTKLTYTLNKKESILGAILVHNTYHLVDNFKEARLDSVDVTGLAQTYTRYTAAAGLPVENTEMLVHYLMRGYEERGEYAPILHHLSENSERVSLLKHIVDDHVSTSGTNELDAQDRITKTYMSYFVVPYEANTACLDKTERSGRTTKARHSDFLAANSTLSDIVANRMLKGANVDEPKVKIEELAIAVGPKRLYTLSHAGDTLGWGRCIGKEEYTSVSPLRGWRQKLIFQLEAKTWNVNMGEIIELHGTGYSPEKMQAPTGPSESTFFLGHEDGSLVAWCVAASPPISFPDESPRTVTFGTVPFEKAANDDNDNDNDDHDHRHLNHHVQCVQMDVHSSSLSAHHGEWTQAGERHSLHEEVPCNRDMMFNMSGLAEAIHDIDQRPHSLLLQRPVSDPIARPPTQIETRGNHEALFVAYAASAKPWSVLRGQSGEARNAMGHLMLTRIDLSDNDNSCNSDSE
jgi:hypothetical protein